MNWKKILIGNWSWKRPFYTVAWVYLLLALFAWFFAGKLIFRPPGTPYPEDRTHFVTLEDGGEKIALYYKAPNGNLPTLLWSHGNAQNLKSLYPALDSLNFSGYGVMSYDYPGYGESTGSPTEKGCYRTALIAYDYLTASLGVSPDKIILVGQSVGSGPACWLASREKHRAVVLISPFLSAFRTVTKIPLLPGDRFPNLSRITKFDTPLIIIHGENDQVIPFDHGEKLFELSPSKNKTFHRIENAGHNDIFLQASFNFVDTLQKLLPSTGKQ